MQILTLPRAYETGLLGFGPGIGLFKISFPAGSYSRAQWLLRSAAQPSFEPNLGPSFSSRCARDRRINAPCLPFVTWSHTPNACALTRNQSGAAPSTGQLHPLSHPGWARTQVLIIPRGLYILWPCHFSPILLEVDGIAFFAKRSLKCGMETHSFSAHCDTGTAGQGPGRAAVRAGRGQTV